MFLCVEVALREASSEEAGVRFQNKAHLNKAHVPFNTEQRGREASGEAGSRGARNRVHPSY